MTYGILTHPITLFVCRGKLFLKVVVRKNIQLQNLKTTKLEMVHRDFDAIFNP